MNRLAKLFLTAFALLSITHSFAQENLAEPLKPFQPYLGKTWKGQFQSADASAQPTYDVARWERALNGQAVQTGAEAPGEILVEARQAQRRFLRGDAGDLVVQFHAARSVAVSCRPVRRPLRALRRAASMTAITARAWCGGTGLAPPSRSAAWMAA